MAKVSKAFKVWGIILIAIGVVFILGSFSDIKELWPMLIISLIPVAIGAWMLYMWMKKKKKAEARERRLRKIEKELEESKRGFHFKVVKTKKYQSLLEKIYAKETDGKNNDKPFVPAAEIVEYLDEQDESHYNVMFNDRKIGEVPEESYDDVEGLLNGTGQEVYLAVNRKMGQDGYIYIAVCTATYYEI